MTVSIRRLFLLAALTCVASAGCRTRPSASPAIEKSPDGKYRGFITGGREEQAFVPCDSDGIWWVEYNRVTVAQVNGAKWNDRCYEVFGNPACEHWTYAELSGDLSPPGKYGHMGWYSRELRLNQISRLSQDVPATCRIRRIMRP